MDEQTRLAHKISKAHCLLYRPTDFGSDLLIHLLQGSGSSCSIHLWLYPRVISHYHYTLEWPMQRLIKNKVKAYGCCSQKVDVYLLVSQLQVRDIIAALGGPGLTCILYHIAIFIDLEIELKFVSTLKPIKMKQIFCWSHN